MVSGFSGLGGSQVKVGVSVVGGWVGALEAATQPCWYSFSLERNITLSYSQECISHLVKSGSKSHLAPVRPP